MGTVDSEHGTTTRHVYSPHRLQRGTECLSTGVDTKKTFGAGGEGAFRQPIFSRNSTHTHTHAHTHTRTQSQGLQLCYKRCQPVLSSRLKKGNPYFFCNIFFQELRPMIRCLTEALIGCSDYGIGAVKISRQQHNAI